MPAQLTNEWNRSGQRGRELVGVGLLGEGGVMEQGGNRGRCAVRAASGGTTASANGEEDQGRTIVSRSVEFLRGGSDF